MKFLLQIFAILLFLSCAKNDKNNLTENNIPNTYIPQTQNNNIQEIYFGKNGIVYLNTETNEYEIKNTPENQPDISFQLPFSLIFDSHLSDSVYQYKSSLFPANKYSLFKVPEIIPFDKTLSIEGRPGIGKYVGLQISGNIGNKKNLYYYLCYKAENYQYAKFSFAVQETDDFYSYNICERYEKLIENNIINPIKINAGDYLFLNILMFRAYAKGECYPGVENCTVYFKTDIRYYLSLSAI